MIIGIDIRVLATGRATGIEEYARHLLGNLFDCDRSVRFKLFMCGRSRAPVPESWLGRNNVALTEVRNSNRLLMARAAMTGRPYLDRLVGGADVFFFPHFLIGGVSPAARRVVTFHDLSFERFPHMFSVKRRFWHAAQRPRWQARTADRLIAVSESTRNDLVSLYGVSPERIATIPSGVDPALSDQRTLFPSGNGRTLLVLCAMEERKNIRGAIRAFELLKETGAYPDLRLTLAGAATDAEREVVRRISESPCADAIERVRCVSSSDRQRLFSSATVFLYPSFFEGFGFPPLEAMACGVPVVTSAVSSLPQVVGDAALLVNPSDARQIAVAVAALLDDRQLAEQLKAKGMERVRRFSWRTAAERTLAVLCDAGASSPHTAP